MSTPELDTTQETLCVRFNDLSLLERALTHASYFNENPNAGLENNERLEFLGDAVLDFVSAGWLYHRFPELPEGNLTRLRAALVRTETLADFARQRSLGPCLLLGRGEEDNGGRDRNSILCAAFEALIGAIYLDQGLAMVRQYVEPMFQPAIEHIQLQELDKDAKSLLQEWSQAKLGLTPIYETITARGPDHAKEFTVNVIIGDEIYGQGVGPNKQTAAQRAAQAALERTSISPLGGLTS
jgi:ribonuclease-3